MMSNQSIPILLIDAGTGNLHSVFHTLRTITDQIVISVAWLIIISLGCSIPFAILVAQPFAMFLVLSVYEERLLGRPVRSIGHIAANPPPPPLPAGQ